MDWKSERFLAARVNGFGLSLSPPNRVDSYACWGRRSSLCKLRKVGTLWALQAEQSCLGLCLARVWKVWTAGLSCWPFWTWWNPLLCARPHELMPIYFCYSSNIFERSTECCKHMDWGLFWLWNVKFNPNCKLMIFFNAFISKRIYFLLSASRHRWSSVIKL